MFGLFKVAVIALSLGLDNFSVAMGLGLKAGDRAGPIKIGLLFAGLQTIFPAIGMLAGDFVGQRIGAIASYAGFAGLILLGLYSLWLSTQEGKGSEGIASPLGLFLTGLTVSIDSLAVGFSLGFMAANFWLSIAMLGGSAFVMTVLGFRFGDRLGTRIGAWAEVVAGSVLTLTGAGLLLEKLLA